MSLLKKDFYEYVNKEWLEQTEIPADRSSISSFAELDLHLEDLLKTTTKEWAQGKKTLPEMKLIHEYVNLYKLILDGDKRAKETWEPAKKYFDELFDLTSFADIAKNHVKYASYLSSLPFQFEVQEDFVDNKKKVLWLSELRTILPSVEYYSKPEAQNLLNEWNKLAQDVLVSYGIDQEKAKSMAQNTLDFDQIIKSNVLTSVEKANYTALYNPLDLAASQALSQKYDLVKMGQEFVERDIEGIVIDNPKFFAKFDEIFSHQNFLIYKDYLITRNLVLYASMVSEALRERVFAYTKQISGIPVIRSLEDYAYDVASKFFSHAVGLWYGENYFGKEAKEKLEKMIEKMIAIYKQRLESNDWLEEETKKMAIRKLNKLGVMVGYPERIAPYYYEIKVDAQGSFIANDIEIGKVVFDYRRKQYLKETDDKLWEMGAAVVNAYFHPFKNHIVFPAGILMKPYFDFNANSSENYGGIGAVIAHEISHAFDNNGSQFDENGSLNNWWGPETLKRFQEKTKDVIELFNTRITPAGPVNGQLTVSENIADMGGFACAYAAAQTEDDFNKELFFENWARIWKAKYRLETAKQLLMTDVHAPAKERANVHLMNSADFQEHYNIQPGDEMYLAPEKRIKIW
ncbi:M13 family metallopeptidase [Mycoplasma sp. Ms02]|uniref:M13 family metallopeptidase n=1 Tax=Mycoplasma sp. Ms02 TaxID=353851 RepID=UPI001C898E04|nr:M13 family metallopeptidase [Mycoplasma sp. Ms02]QZE12238.1 M13 family metallopeptidase [Mycoplasma sp. Ms02]